MNMDVLERAGLPSVDVAIPSYQYKRYLRDAATSVLNQDVENLRLLIIDNGSTDGSQELAQEIAAGDDRVELFLNEENRGMFDSYNRALDWASADYLVVLDADDMLASGSLRLGTGFLEKHPSAALLYGVEGRLVDSHLDPGRCNVRWKDSEVISGSEFIRRTCRDSFCDIGAPALIMRTSAVKRAGHFNEELIRTNDFELYLRLALQGDVARVNEVLGIRRIHGAQLSKPYDEDRVLDFVEHEKAFEMFFDRDGSSLPDAERLRALARRRVGDYAFWYAVARLLHRESKGRAIFNFAAERRGMPTWLPPLGFLFRKRWIRSLVRKFRTRIYGPVPLAPTFEVPTYW